MSETHKIQTFSGNIIVGDTDSKHESDFPQGITSATEVERAFKQGRTESGQFSDETDIHDKELSAGVAKVEALQKVWGKWGYYVLVAGLFVASYIYSLDGLTTYNYLAIATSTVMKHSLTGTVTVAGSIIMAVGKPFMAKLADYLGRGETYLIVLIFYIVAYILFASAQNIGQIAGAQILYSVGNTGLQMMTQVIIADVTTLKYRTFVAGLLSLPYIINTPISAEISQGVLSGGGWRWGYGMFAIMVPACLIPVIGTIFYGQWKAKKEGVLNNELFAEKNVFKNPIKGLNTFQKEIDLPGCTLIALSLALILIPLGLAPTASKGWNSPHIIAMLVVGCVLLPVWVVWELVIADKYGYFPIAPARFFKNMNIAAACVIGFFDFVSFYLQYTYQYSFVYVVKTDWSYRDLNYFNNVQTFGLCSFGLVAGIILIYYRRPKWLLVGGLVVRLLGVGIMIHSRGALGSTVELVFCQLLQGMGGGFAAVLILLIAQALVPHTDVAVVTALIYLFTEVGTPIGSAIATAIWTNQMPGQLAAHVPTTNSTLLTELYSSITIIKEYPAGDPIREGVITAYSNVMRNLCIGATVTGAIPLIAAIFFVSDMTLGNAQNNWDGRGLTGDKGDVENQPKEKEIK
ncbi:major facilitator superfamily domain-containing protein, partial [Dichotomocladium elegans]